MKVLAAVSGGVDSAVAMARAVAAGHAVTAVHLALSGDPRATAGSGRGCCTPADAHDARRAADVVGVPFYVWDMAREFREHVVRDFVSEYRAGRTPNPCVRCNEHIKFRAVLDRALALGFDAVATGHHARLEHAPEGPVLRRAVDVAKDQSYVLAVLGRERLARCLFPVGDTPKDRIRQEAHDLGIAVAAKPDSHDICFIPDGDTSGFLRRHLGDQHGPVVDAASGERIGSHAGTHGFTIGQRRGIGVEQPSTTGRPRYVLGIEPVSRTVTVGERDRLRVGQILGSDVVWHGDPPGPEVDLQVQVRAHGVPVPARVSTPGPGSDAMTVTVLGELLGVAPGQSVVLYRADRVVGQATVCGTGEAQSVGR